MLDQLTQDHDRLREIADRLDTYFQEPSAPVDIEFSRLRWALIRQLTLHLAREKAVFGTHAAGADGCMDESLDTQFQEYMTAWDARAIQRGWVHYCRVSRALLRQLRARMRREEAYLFPRYAGTMASAAMH